MALPIFTNEQLLELLSRTDRTTISEEMISLTAELYYENKINHSLQVEMLGKKLLYSSKPVPNFAF